MKQARLRTLRSQHRTHPVCDRRTDQRVHIDFRLMYSAQDDREELIMGDGSVVDLSNKGLRVRGNMAVKSGLEMTLFLYLPDGRDPLFVLSAKVAWSKGHEFGVEILKMNVRERNRLRYFLSSNLQL
ncbi:MAG TPA: PilZ domain-containing protein [Nitrospira sp.]|nr:PilZ domain-containing protein [Nitrospira sp.]